MKETNALKVYCTTGALLGWLAVILQLYLMIIHSSHSLPEIIIRFFSYFTILTNIIAAICFTAVLFKHADLKSSFFSRPGTLAATTVYIIIVGAVYNLVLRFIWEPKGLQKVVDELLHSVLPVLFIFFWLLFVPKNTLQWGNAFSWLIFPVCYIIYTLVHGAMSGFYPYPFVDVDEIGYDKALINGGLLFLVFFLFSLVIIATGKFIGKKKVSAAPL